MAEIASETGHYYTWSGEPAYTIIGKNGKERNTNVRDARNLSLVPSVTEVMKVIAKPGLERWKMEQVLMASLTLPMAEGETLEKYAVRVMNDSREQTRKACDRGTFIHGELEKWLSGGLVHSDNVDLCHRVYEKLKDLFGPQMWSVEKSFACSLGYGGKCDLHSIDMVVDFKTKEFGENNLPTIYDEHAMQLAAYRRGLNVDGARCAICFVSTTNPIVHVVEIDDAGLERGFQMFIHALEYWKE
ncbi:MAG: hypothetical protein JZU65_22630, partial [Chlorobium sp.]|nr:hypothetical protein [Chlorobium sp.]